MKRRLKFLVVTALLCISGTQSYAQKSFGTAVEYMNYIGEQYTQLTEDQWDYTKSVANDKSAKKIESKRQELLKTNKKAQDNIKKLSGFEGNTEYRDSVVAFLELNYNVLNNDYEKIMNMEEIAEQSYDAMEAYLLAQEIAGEKIKNASAMLSVIHRKFAEKYNITIIDSQSKKSEKLEKAGIMYKYYNKIYLIFFKAYKQEAYLLDAVNRGDVNAMEQNKNSLLDFSTEGIKALDDVKPFDGDNSLKEACLEILKFYKDEAETKSPLIIDFFLKKENFESIKKAFDAKKEKDRNQEDVDQFNAAVNDYNAASGVYNSTNESLNKGRGKNLDNWNSTSTKFTKKHV
jgi:hypothetical protein